MSEEGPGGKSGNRCPGESCSRWRNGLGATYEAKVKNQVWRACPNRCTGPPLPPGTGQPATDAAEYPGLIARVEELYAARELRLPVAMDYFEEMLLLEFAGALGVLRDSLAANTHQRIKSLEEMVRAFLTNGKG